jgi:hypothetical protein
MTTIEELRIYKNRFSQRAPELLFKKVKEV